MSSGTTVGIEVEYPTVQRGTRATFKNKAEGSFGLEEEVQRFDLPDRADPTYDGTVGLEVVSDRLDIDIAAGWYEDVLRDLNTFDVHEPCGLLSGRGSTAGLHIHFSHATNSQARRLAQVSRQPWMQVFACSSITENNHKVFRDNYCRIDEYDAGRYSVVHSCAGSGHYEWRLPEPMTHRHFNLLMEFLDRFMIDEEDAIEWAKSIVHDGDDRLTSVKRAKEVGLKDLETPDLEYRDWGVRRGIPHEIESSPMNTMNEAEQFYDNVRWESQMPYIYTITDPQGKSYFVFKSNNYSSDQVFESDGYAFRLDDVFRIYDSGEIVRAESFDPEDGRAAIREQDRNNDDAVETVATDLLREVME